MISHGKWHGECSAQMHSSIDSAVFGQPGIRLGKSTGVVDERGSPQADRAVDLPGTRLILDGEAS